MYDVGCMTKEGEMPLGSAKQEEKGSWKKTLKQM